MMTEELLIRIQEMAARIKELERENETNERNLCQLTDELAEARRENAELRKDAERYLWIASDPYHDGYAWWTQDICVFESMDSSFKPTKTQVDIAIDKAMK
jgi:hypothetical protein